MGNVQLAKDIHAAFGRGDIPTVLARNPIDLLRRLIRRREGSATFSSDSSSFLRSARVWL
jgi:hypothetical protein